MKKLLILTTLALGLLTSTPAVANTKVAYIDMLKAVEGYYKTKVVRNQLKEAEDRLKGELQGRSEGFTKLQGEINEIQKDLQKPELSDQAKKKRAEEGQGKLVELQKSKQEIEGFAAEGQKNLQAQLNRMMKGIYDDIQNVVNERVKVEGYDLVLDKSSAGRVGFPIVIYSNPNADITEAVVTELNKNAPKEEPKKEEAKKEEGAKKSEGGADAKKKK